MNLYTSVLDNSTQKCDFLQMCYSRTPLIRPPSESHWCGRIRGMVIREGLDYFPWCTCLTCAPRNTRAYIRQCVTASIVHTEHGFRGVPVAVSYRGKRSDQATTVCRGKTRNKVFTNVCILFLEFSKNYMQCLSYQICLTKTVHVDTRLSTDTDARQKPDDNTAGQTRQRDTKTR